MIPELSTYQTVSSEVRSRKALRDCPDLLIDLKARPYTFGPLLSAFPLPAESTDRSPGRVRSSLRMSNSRLLGPPSFVVGVGASAKGAKV